MQIDELEVYFANQLPQKIYPRWYYITYEGSDTYIHCEEGSLDKLEALLDSYVYVGSHYDFTNIPCFKLKE
jgi:hypothetical protein